MHSKAPSTTCTTSRNMQSNGLTNSHSNYDEKRRKLPTVTALKTELMLVASIYFYFLSLTKKYIFLFCFQNVSTRTDIDDDSKPL